MVLSDLCRLLHTWRAALKTGRLRAALTLMAECMLGPRRAAEVPGLPGGAMQCLPAWGSAYPMAPGQSGLYGNSGDGLPAGPFCRSPWSALPRGCASDARPFRAPVQLELCREKSPLSQQARRVGRMPPSRRLGSPCQRRPTWLLCPHRVHGGSGRVL